MMRLGEFRTKTREQDNGLSIFISNYDDNTITYDECELDIITSTAIYLRRVPRDKVEDEPHIK